MHRDHPPDMFKLVHYEACPHAGGWHPSEMPSCIFWTLTVVCESLIHKYALLLTRFTLAQALPSISSIQILAKSNYLRKRICDVLSLSWTLLLRKLLQHVCSSISRASADVNTNQLSSWHRSKNICIPVHITRTFIFVYVYIFLTTHLSTCLLLGSYLYAYILVFNCHFLEIKIYL